MSKTFDCRQICNLRVMYSKWKSEYTKIISDICIYIPGVHLPSFRRKEGLCCTQHAYKDSEPLHCFRRWQSSISLLGLVRRTCEQN